MSQQQILQNEGSSVEDVADVAEAATDSDASSYNGNEFIKTNPLPPISLSRKETNDEGQDPEHGGKNLKRTNSGDLKISVAVKQQDKPVSRDSRGPQINRREMYEDDQSRPLLGKRSVSFAETFSLATDEGDSDHWNRGCQTEWSWLQDLKSLGKTVSDEGSESEHSEAEANTASKQDTLITEKVVGLIKSVSEAVKAENERNVVEAQPEPTIDDEYGIPMLDIVVGDSDFSDIDDDVEVAAGAVFSDEDDDDEPDVSGVGPPNILQHKRESSMTLLEAEDPEILARRLAESQGRFDRVQPLPGTLCDYCGKEVKPFPTLAMQEQLSPEELFCCDKYREFVHNALTHPLNQKFYDDIDISVEPHPPHGSKMAQRAAKERETVRLREKEIRKQQAAAVAAAASGGGAVPSGIYGSRGHRGVAGMNPEGSQTELSSKESQNQTDNPRAPKRTTSRLETTVVLESGTGAATREKMGPVSVARQMKTVNYQLSSQRCLEEGWTVRAPTPVKEEAEDQDLFAPQTADGFDEDEYRPDEMMDFSDINIRIIKDRKPRKLIVRYYPNGHRFLIMFPNGTGNVFYNSGNVAVSIVPGARGRLSYLLHDDTSDRKPNLLGIFESNGHGCCYFQSGHVRLILNPLGGIEHYMNGGKKRRWRWKHQVQHVHAPPFQPICFALNQNLSIRVMSQENIVLTYRHKDRSCRYNMGTKLKLVRPQLLPKPEIDQDREYIRNAQLLVESLLTKVNNLLRFPKSTRLEKLKPIHGPERSSLDGSSQNARPLLLGSPRTSSSNGTGTGSRDHKKALPPPVLRVI